MVLCAPYVQALDSSCDFASGPFSALQVEQLPAEDFFLSKGPVVSCRFNPLQHPQAIEELLALMGKSPLQMAPKVSLLHVLPP